MCQVVFIYTYAVSGMMQGLKLHNIKQTNVISLASFVCDKGDSIMADKGFNVQDLFAPYDVTINIPTFFRKKNRMTGKTVLKDRAISSKRVHIERINQELHQLTV
jgi:hypothetical protein